MKLFRPDDEYVFGEIYQDAADFILSNNQQCRDLGRRLVDNLTLIIHPSRTWPELNNNETGTSAYAHCGKREF